MFEFLKRKINESKIELPPVVIDIKTGPASGQNPNIPPELADFLGQGKELQYDRSQCEAGRVKLKRLQDLEVEEIKISTKKVSRISETDDPNKNHSGAYRVPAVSLVADCENYDPDFILLWLPQEQMFGALSGEYTNELLVFPGASWQDIVNDPVRYINAQWKGDYSIAKDFNPWQKYRFE